MDWEVEFYSNIMEQALAVLDNNDEKFIWKCRKIIELMNFLKYSYNKLLVKNALILILSLFENHYIGLVTSKPKNLDYFSKQEKKILIDTLKEEFLA
ncbi:MAG: hypothetical protein ACFFAH_01950 [Promethearchaeota archaeon]